MLPHSPTPRQNNFSIATLGLTLLPRIPLRAAPTHTRTPCFSHSRANDTTGSVAAANLLSVAAAGAGVGAGVLFALSARFPGHQDWSLALLYDIVIPGLALGALMITTMLLVRASAVRLDDRFGRKSNLVAATSLLFVFSCFYRAINIADEGAATCRGAPSPFNAPAAGRFVAGLGRRAGSGRR